ncbi:MAG: macro domain-containing protein [Gammaproteobacteria bacterium]|nr:macro domain-containing protein [Gammaproteobacteria bacterium]
MQQAGKQIFFGDREVLIQISDLLYAPAEVIVNPANSGLSHGGGLAAQILAAAGDELDRESEQLIREHGRLEAGMAVYTTAGRLPFAAVIHAVGPMMGSGDEQKKIEQTVHNSLLLCETNGWHTIAFPAISTGIFNVPVETCARAFHRAVTRYWDARAECEVEKVIICLSDRMWPTFCAAFTDDAPGAGGAVIPHAPVEAKPESVGHITLSDEDIAGLDNADISDWFK